MSKQSPRRDLHFDSIDDIVADLEMLTASDVETTGQFTFGQIMEHLAITLDLVVGKLSPPPIPAYMRWFARLGRPLVLSRPMSPGFKLPKQAQAVFWPDSEIDPSEAYAHLKESIDRYNMKDPLPKHPLFGTMNREQCDQLQCRHFELHLSFVHPAQHVG